VTDASAASVSFEAVKVKLTQGKDGMLVTLAIHPDEVPDVLVRAFVGSRWGAATEGLRRYLGIASRSQLKTDAAARELFHGLRERFERASHGR
jgi:hypothetical protein